MRGFPCSFILFYVVPESLGSLKNCVIILEMVISNCVVFICSFCFNQLGLLCCARALLLAS